MAQWDSKIIEWYPGIYGRLSDEDGRTGVSMSITNQIDILTGFVKEKGWNTPKIFYDDNRTGTNFDREGFQEMYRAAKEGIINVIIIKDTSRFGRNWVKSGEYFEKIEEMGVRFISIQEGIDTADPKCPALKMLPFYFIFNEWHSATTSEKIRAVIQKQAEQGKHINYLAPYGYDKDPDDKYKLVIDPVVAPIVRRIFEMRLQRMPYNAIARTLNSEGVLSPSGYNEEKHGLQFKKARINKWSANSIIEITTNPLYCGDVVRNRVGRISYKNHKNVRKSEDEWIIVKDMHEPYISREDFQACADIRKEKVRVRSTREATVSAFTGLLICPDCNYRMARSSQYYDLKTSDETKVKAVYNCGVYMRMGKDACSSHYIVESDLEKLVVDDIREIADEILQDENAIRKRFYAIKAKSSGSQLNADKTALKKVKKRLAELDKLLQAAFEKSVLGGESSEMFTGLAQKYKGEKEDLLAQVNRLTLSIEKQSRVENDIDIFISLMKKHANITSLDRDTALELIDYITISAFAVTPI